MKRFFNLIPVALAAFALASCSSDDLNIANGENELTYSPNQLMVQIEGDESEGTTRGGYVTNIYNYNLYSAMAFDLGEQLKLYHDATSWKPEIWTADAYGQYKNATGIAVFKKAGSTITADEDAYGIYPSTASVFGNENRTSIQYDLSTLAWVDYAVDASKTYEGTTGDGAITKYYKGEFPLWGVKASGAQVMTFKHLAGILRLDIANIGTLPVAVAPGANPQYKYIVIRSNTKKLAGVINTAANLLAPTTGGLNPEALDPSTFMTTTPKLEVEAATNVAALNATPITEAGAEAADNVIVIRIDATTIDEHVMAYVPILPEMAAGDVDVYVTPVLTPGAATTIDLSDAANILYQYSLTADIINDCNKSYTIGGTKPYTANTTVQRGVTYKINDDSTNRNTTAKTPFQLAEGIKEADMKAYRDFEVTFTQPIEVKNTDDSPQNFMLNLAGGDDRYGLQDGWELKHNVTVHLTLKENAEGAAVPSVLYIKTKGGKKLTLDITNGTTLVDSIVVMKDGLQNEGLVLQTSAAGTRLPNIHVYQGNDDKVTIKSGVYNANGVTPALSMVKLNSNVTFDIPNFGNTNEVNNINLAKGVTKVTIKSGDIKNIDLAAGADAIGADVEIYSEGQVGINNVDFANMPKTVGTAATKYVDTYNLKFVSKFIPNGTNHASYMTTTFGGAGTHITSADQLIQVTNTTGDFDVVGEYDLNGTEATWTSLAGLTQNVAGAQYFRFSDATARAITGKATIKNLKGANGLIADWTPAANKAITNFKFDGSNAVTATSDVATALLVGSVAPAGAGVSIEDIDFAATSTNTIKTANAAIAGTGILAGAVNNTNAALTVKNVNVAKGTVGESNKGATAALAAVIGKFSGVSASNILTLANVKVAEGVSVTGFKNIGGIIGEIGVGKVIYAAMKADGSEIYTAQGADYNNGANILNTSAATLTTYKINNAPYSQNLPTYGQFFGTVLSNALVAAGDITIMGELTKQTAFTGTSSNLWGYYLADTNGEYWPWIIYRFYNEIGHYGYESYDAGSGNMKVRKIAAINDINMIIHTGTSTTYNVTKVLRPTVNGSAPTDDAIGSPTVRYFGYVKTAY